MSDVKDAAGKRIDLESKYRDEDGRVYLTGLQALVRVPVEQMRADARDGLRTRGFVSGYPGSPLAGLDLELEARAALLAERGIVHQPGLNEELAATAVMGSQIAMRFGATSQDGVVGIWYGKAPGLDRSADAIRTANYFGTTRKGGVLAYVGDDPTCKSSTVPSNSDGLLAELALPVLYPGNVQEVLDFGAHGIAMSRASGLWTAVKVVTQVADGGGTARVSPGRLRPVFPVGPDGQPTGRAEPATLSPPQILTVERDIYEVRLPAALEYARLNKLNEITQSTPRDWLGIIAPGHLYYEVLTALRRLGLGERDLPRYGIRLLRLGLVHPVDSELIRDFGRGLTEIVVAEDKRGRLESAVRDALYGTTDAPLVLGKFRPDGTVLLPQHGALDADGLIRALRERLRQRVSEDKLPQPSEVIARPLLPVLPRTPYFCSGCPHNTSLRVPDGGLVGAGIGCHSMVAFMAPNVVGEVTGVTQMGGEGAQWIGAEPFVTSGHLFQNLGEGTFFHSGEMAVRAAVAAGSHITYKILYNRAVAMTGGQHAAGDLGVPAMARLLTDIGVKKIIITAEDRSRYRGVRLPHGVELLDRDDIIEAQERLRAVPGVTVLIHDQQCAAEARRLRKRGKQAEPAKRVVINERVCEGCGDCGAASNCMSVRPVDTDFGPKTTIDQSSCNKDYSCVKGDCPSFVTVTPGQGRVARALSALPGGIGRGRSPLPGVRPGSVPEPGEAPEPTPIVNPDDFSVRMPGIGGTGVITVAQIVGTAALLDGKYVTGLDQTGLAQKGGAVVSDLHVTAGPAPGSAKVPAGGVDLLLAFDLVVALNPANLSGASPDRTVVVATSTQTPTGQMIGTGARQPEVAAMTDVINARTRADLNIFVDMAAVAHDLFGSTTTANIFGLGIAYQLGALPVSAASLERAITLNGVAVQSNLRAFRWGRLRVANPAELDTARAAAASTRVDKEPAASVVEAAGNLDVIASADGVRFGGELGRLAASRAVDLAGYQDQGYARQYLADVARVADAEQAVLPGSTALAEAVARYLYKLMAYKDEYEVARLHLADEAQARVQAVTRGEPATVHWVLHPPALRAIGMKDKISLGPWFRPAFTALHAMRRVRGTRLDPFGYAHVRRVERQLIDQYRSWLRALPGTLTAASHPVAVEIAAAPDMVRGYENIKLGNVQRYQATRGALLKRYAADAVPGGPPGS